MLSLSGSRPLQIAACAMLLGLGGLAGWYLGSGDPPPVEPPANGRAANEVQAQAPGCDQLEVLRTRHEVDRRSLEILRVELARQKEQAAERDEALRFYRSLMTPGKAGSGVSVRVPELVSLGRDRYAFRLIVQQQASQHQQVTGELEIAVEGLSQGKSTRLSLAQLEGSEPPAPRALAFRYFQILEGEIQLPEDFEPRTLSVDAELSEPEQTELRQRFPWQLQERFTHVGK